MKKLFFGLMALALLTGASCGSGVSDTKEETAAPQAKTAEQTEVETAWSGFLKAAADQDDAAFVKFVSVELDDITIAGAYGFFSVSQPEIDWNASKWSSDKTSIDLKDKDGNSLGTWAKDSAGNWKVDRAFWFE